MPTFLNSQTHKPTVLPVNTQVALPFLHPTTVYNPVPTPPVQSQASIFTTELADLRRVLQKLSNDMIGPKGRAPQPTEK